MLDEVVHDIMESLPQELAARQNFLDGLNQPAQAFGFNLMLGFHVADAVGGGRLAAAESRTFSFSKTISSFG